MDADFIIYHSTIGGERQSLEELLTKNALLKDFKAVREGNVWCTGKNLYQETTQLGEMVPDIHQMLTSLRVILRTVTQTSHGKRLFSNRVPVKRVKDLPQSWQRNRWMPAPLTPFCTTAMDPQPGQA